jgi:Glycosyl transferase family 2
MAQNHTSPVTDVTIQVSIIVPARNEEASLERCLRSLVEQQGIGFEVIAVDDASTDRTPQIIENFAGMKECPLLRQNPFLLGMTALKANVPEPGWTGKANAVWQAAQGARGTWLLFTDADTVHETGSLARAVAEAHEQNAVMLSYSPRQEVESLAERAVMPLVFAELATRFRPKEVRDPKSPVAAANGQYILIRRDVYLALAGHKAVYGELLEDVALAKRVKQAGGKIQFRFGGDQVRTRMYRSWTQMVEGWTKNLVLLFPDARTLARKRVTEFAAILMTVLVAAASWTSGATIVAGLSSIAFAAMLTMFVVRITRSHAGFVNELIAFAGLPIFAWLLVRSAEAHERGEIPWKGRVYSASESMSTVGTSHTTDQSAATDVAGAVPVVISPFQESNGLPHKKV